MNYVKVNDPRIGLTDKNEVFEVVSACIEQFENWRKTASSGIANGSCCAALRMDDGSIRFGNSRGTGDATIPSGMRSVNHAEIHAVESTGGQSFMPFLYVDLVPCARCRTYLEDNLVVEHDRDELDITVFYQFDTTEEMSEVHALSEDEQIQYLKTLMGL